MAACAIYVSILTVRNYRLFASGQLVKLIGVWMMFVAQDWLVLKLSDNSATAVGITVAAQFTPVLLLTLVAGALADRYDKRKLLLLANGAFASLAILFALLVLTEVVQLWHVYVLAGAMGIANAIENPTRQAFVSECRWVTRCCRTRSRSTRPCSTPRGSPALPSPAAPSPCLTRAHLLDRNGSGVVAVGELGADATGRTVPGGGRRGRPAA